MLSKEEIRAYLDRLGIEDIQPPTKSFLFALHRAHVQRIPWQTVDIFAGKPAPMDIRSSINLMLNHRSGYCFHLNGAFSELLRSLGYTVYWHKAGVQPLGEEPRVNSFHLGLTVLLKDVESKEERWIVDVGLGDIPYEPLPLLSGTYIQDPLTYRVTESSVVSGGWRMVHDPGASFAGVDVDHEVVQDLKLFEPKHEHYSCSAQSPWINLFLVRNRHAQGSNELRGCIWGSMDKDGVKKTEIRTQSQWLEVLGDLFDEHLVTYSKLEREALWKKAWQKHEEWQRKNDKS